MLEFFSRPYRLNLSGPSSWRLGLSFGTFVFLFLVIFEPFGLGTLPRAVWPVALGYGATCGLVMWLVGLASPRLLPTWFNELRWTTGRQILWILLNIACVGLGNALFTVLAGIASLSLRVILWFEVYTILIGIFPVTVLVLWNEMRLRGHFRSGSDQLNSGLRSAQVATAPHGVTTASPGATNMDTGSVMVTIPSETGREDMVLRVDDLLFIRSAGNYVEVHYLEHGHACRKVVRGSLKQVAGSLSVHPRLWRCHKSHLVNLDRVVRVSGNAQGYHLHLPDVADTVPVSRQLNDRLGEVLAGRT